MSALMDDQLRLDPSPHERECRQYAERVYRTLAALEPLYDVHQAIDWLTSSQASLGGDRPAYLLSLHTGTTRVERVVTQLLDEVFT